MIRSCHLLYPRDQRHENHNRMSHMSVISHSNSKDKNMGEGQIHTNINNEMIFLISLFVSIIVAQGAETIFCNSESPNGCLTHCFCILCSQNETLADGLLDGSISPATLSTTRHSDEGICISSMESCSNGYYAVSGANVLKTNGDKCTSKGVTVTLVVVLCIGLALILTIVVYVVYKGYCGRSCPLSNRNIETIQDKV